MYLFIYILNQLKKLIQFFIFITGKTLVLYITVFKLWYFIIINLLFNPNYNDINHINLIICGWFFITTFLKLVLLLIFIYFLYNYFLLFKFLKKKICNEFKIFLKYFK